MDMEMKLESLIMRSRSFCLMKLETEEKEALKSIYDKCIEKYGVQEEFDYLQYLQYCDFLTVEPIIKVEALNHENIHEFLGALPFVKECVKKRAFQWMHLNRWIDGEWVTYHRYLSKVTILDMKPLEQTTQTSIHTLMNMLTVDVVYVLKWIMKCGNYSTICKGQSCRVEIDRFTKIVKDAFQNDVPIELLQHLNSL